MTDFLPGSTRKIREKKSIAANRLSKAEPKRNFLNKLISPSGLQDFRTLGHQDIRTSGLQDFRTSGLQDFRTSGLQDFRTSGHQNFRTSRH